MLRRCIAGLPLLAVALPAQASDFGCVAEWLDYGLVLAVPAGLVWAGLVQRVRRETHLAVAGSAVLLALLAIVGTRCTYGHDPDGWATLFVGVGALPVGLAHLWRVRRRAAPGRGEGSDGAALPERTNER